MNNSEHGRINRAASHHCNPLLVLWVSFLAYKGPVVCDSGIRVVKMAQSIETYQLRFCLRRSFNDIIAWIKKNMK